MKGVGKTQPDESSTVTLSDGVEVPLGKPVTNLEINSELQYNEYPFQNSIKIIKFYTNINIVCTKRSYLIISFFFVLLI